MQNTKQSGVPLKEFNYLGVFETIAGRWYWVVIALCLGLISSTMYIYGALPVYIANASFKIEERRSELSELVSLRNLYDRSNKAESERFILKSRNVLLKALKAVHHDVSFYKKKGLLLRNIYPEKPFDIHVTRPGIKSSDMFRFKSIDRFTYKLEYSDEDEKISAIYHYGHNINTKNFHFKITQTGFAGSNLTYIFRLSNPDQMLRELTPKLNVEDTQNTNILSLKFAYENPHFAKDFLNAVLDQYLAFDRTQRSLSINQTEIYIGTLLQKMSRKIRASGDDIRAFKKNNKLSDNTPELTSNSKKLTEFETQKHLLGLKQLNIKQLEKHFDNSTCKEELQYGLQDLADPQFNRLTESYNVLVMKKKHLMNFYTGSAPEISRIENEIDIYSKTIKKYLHSQFLANNGATRLINKEIASIQQETNKLPLVEQQFVDLKSKFDINQKVYNYLSEKKLEAQISRESIIPAASIIDRAILPATPVSPDAAKIYGLAVLISTIIGISSIFLVHMMNPFISTRENITEHTEIPIIGTVSRHLSLSKTEKIPFIERPRSAFAESLRSLRSNLTFLASEKTNKAICITSEISGEGKSFIALNIAASLTLIDKKVLLIDTDMRNPIIHHFFDTTNTCGLSNYLSGQLNLTDVIKSTPVSHLDFIASGDIPPNPSELLHKPKMQILINKLALKYDFIILDSAPVGLVADAKPLMLISDINLFILRCGISVKSFATRPDILQKELKLSNFGIILNDHKEDHFNSYYSTHPDIYSREIEA